MKKQIVALLLMLTLCASLCAGACAAGQDSDLSYSIDENGVLTISGTGTVTGTFTLQIPYEERCRVLHIVVEDGITGLDAYAFEVFEVTLESVSLPESLSTVGINALGTKGAMDFTIYGENPDALRELLTQSNEDYEYFRYVQTPVEGEQEAVPAEGV